MSNHGNGNPARASKVRRQQVRNQRAVLHAQAVKAMHAAFERAETKGKEA